MRKDNDKIEETVAVLTAPRRVVTCLFVAVVSTASRHGAGQTMHESCMVCSFQRWHKTAVFRLVAVHSKLLPRLQGCPVQAAAHPVLATQASTAFCRGTNKINRYMPMAR